MIHKGLVDIHCHILPGVDDGAKDWNEAEQLLRLQIEQGVRCIYLTPHFRKELFHTQDSVIEERFEEIKKLANNIDPELELHLGREYFADSYLLEKIDQGDIAYLGESKHILVEFSRGSSLRYMKSFLIELRNRNCIPIIAHIERYPYVVEKKEVLSELIGLGAEVQINAESVLGKMGFKIKRFCKYLIKHDLVDYVASDAHRMDKRTPNLGQCYEYLVKKYDKETANYLCCCRI